MGITVSFPHDPIVRFTPDAWADLFYITSKVKTEVGMLGTLTQVQEYEFLVDRIFLPRQEVNGATTEMQIEHVGLFVEELLAQPDGEEIRERLGFWAHSHASMGLTASNQDQKMLEELVALSRRPIVAVRTNHRNQSTADILYPSGLQLDGVPCEPLAADQSDLANKWDALVQNNVRPLHSKVISPPNGGGKPKVNRSLSDFYDAHPDWPGYQPEPTSTWWQGFDEWASKIGFVDLKDDDSAERDAVEDILWAVYYETDAERRRGALLELMTEYPHLFYETKEALV